MASAIANQVAALLAIVAAFQASPAFACEFCGGGGDYSSAGIMAWLAASAHASILEALASANAALARGEIGTAILAPPLLGLSYGVVHTLGPGHGKIVFGAHSLARTSKPPQILSRALAIGALHVLSAALIIVALTVVFGTFGSPKEQDLHSIRYGGYALISLIGVVLIARAAFPHLPFLAHRHGDTASSAGMIMSVGLVPCTGSLLVITFAVASNALALGLVVIAAIGVGMAVTLAAIGLIAGAARKRLTSDHSHGPGARLIELAGGTLLVLTGLFFLHGLTL